ncbi:MAG: adenine phosphoribosyltransferase [Clostridiaceae bacterium]|nr:adenine phosphoribosyltransferase [Clostridiaceae bacterium]
MHYYRLNIAGLTRYLPILPISPELAIAGFVILGDTELVCAVAPLLAEQLPEVDFLLTAETKGIPLIQEMARYMDLPRYMVARKSVKLYMTDPISTPVKSISTAARQTLYLDRHDAERMRGKRVAVVDDVISTGDSLDALETLVRQAGGEVVARACILAEGDAIDRPDLVYLQELPLIPLPVQVVDPIVELSVTETLEI